MSVRAELDAVIAQLAAEEREVLRRMRAAGIDEEEVLYRARRVLMGQQQYGALDLARDERDFDEERHAERADDAIYGGFDELRRDIRAGRWKP